MPRNKPSLIGQRFGKLLVTGDAPRGKSNRNACSICLCECGKELVATNYNLLKGIGRSCIKCRPQKHGMSRSGTYRSWIKMKVRCYDPNFKQFSDYGGRGIRVCQRWMDFQNFVADMGQRPEGMSIERRDNNKNYSKENCRWATKAEQNRNRRDTRIMTIRGATGCLSELCRHFDIAYHHVKLRLKKGVDAEAAFFTPNSRGKLPPYGSPPPK